MDGLKKLKKADVRRRDEVVVRRFACSHLIGPFRHRRGSILILLFPDTSKVYCRGPEILHSTLELTKITCCLPVLATLYTSQIYVCGEVHDYL